MNPLASILRTVAILAGIWFILMLLFCVAWVGLMRAIHQAEREMHEDEEENSAPPPPENVIEWDFPNPVLRDRFQVRK